MRMLFITAVALIGLVASLSACTSPFRPSPTPMSVPLNAAAWSSISDPSPYPLTNTGSALSFDFPTSGSMHYLYTASPRQIVRGTLSVTLQVSTSGPVVFTPLDTTACGLAPSVRPFFWANEAGNGDSDRWWSNPRAFTLAGGASTLTVPLEPAAWSNVSGRYGNADPAIQYAFERALTNVTRFGVTFGGGCSFGHGIRVSGGTATFTLSDYSVQ